MKANMKNTLIIDFFFLHANYKKLKLASHNLKLKYT